jgi:hypothetical protein
MASSVYPSVSSPTGYTDVNGNPVNADGSVYSGTTSGTAAQIGSSSSGLQSLTPAQTTAKSISLTGAPSITESANPIAQTQYSGLPVQSTEEQAPVIKLAEGGLPSPTYNYNQTGFPRMSPAVTHGHATQLYGTPGKTQVVGDMSNKLIGMKEGGNIPEDHNPEFFSEGGLQHAYVKGGGDGTSDSVPAMLATGEFVIPADVVSSLGNGDNDSGAKTLQKFLAVIRKHKRAADSKSLPPDSKGPLAYLTDAKRKKVKA